MGQWDCVVVQWVAPVGLYLEGERFESLSQLCVDLWIHCFVFLKTHRKIAVSELSVVCGSVWVL